MHKIYSTLIGFNLCHFNCGNIINFSFSHGDNGYIYNYCSGDGSYEEYGTLNGESSCRGSNYTKGDSFFQCVKLGDGSIGKFDLTIEESNA